MNRLALLPLLALAAAPCLAQDPAANAPAEPPTITARLASVDAVEAAIQGVLGAKDGLPVGLLAVEPAEMKALYVSAMFGVPLLMSPAAPAPSGDEALFDD